MEAPAGAPVRPSAARSRRGPPASAGKEGTRRRDPEAGAGGGACGCGRRSSFQRTRPRPDHAPALAPTTPRLGPAHPPCLGRAPVPGHAPCWPSGPGPRSCARRPLAALWRALRPAEALTRCQARADFGAGAEPSTGSASLTLGLWPAGAGEAGRRHREGPVPRPLPRLPVLRRKCSLFWWPREGRGWSAPGRLPGPSGTRTARHPPTPARNHRPSCASFREGTEGP